MEDLSLAMLKAFAKFVTVITELDNYFRVLASAGTVRKTSHIYIAEVSTMNSNSAQQ